MSFQIPSYRELQVNPALPASLKRLPELAHNLLWSWDHHLRTVFRRLDPIAWRSSHNPVLMLSSLPQETLVRAAADPRYMAVYDRACERFDTYMKRAPMDLRQPGDETLLIAYFSMEYGLTDCLPVYSGGLGVLSGDHMKGSSDAGLPLIGVGLAYQKGYHQQSLNPDGWQMELYPVNDFHLLPCRPALDAQGNEIRVQVNLPFATIAIKLWLVESGGNKLFLLDTNIPENATEEIRNITENLYGGDHGTRIKQEIVLGIGGLRALKKMGYLPTVFHMNEGHAAFLALERIRDLMDEHQLSFAEALEATRESNIFTTHTSVPAGIDLFEGSLVWDHLSRFCNEGKITPEQLFSLGRKVGGDTNEKFSMAVTAMHCAAFRNAVSILHGAVSRDMWGGLWPNLPTDEVPITAVTNGTHLPSMLNGDLATVFDSYLQPDWRDRHQEPGIWAQVDEIPSSEIWEAHRRRKKQLSIFVRERAALGARKRHASASEIRRIEEGFDPEVFTIGFARRFATYKRATLLFRDPERLKRILLSADRPVQIVISGKAHPKDTPGKTFIREIAQLSRDPELRNRVVFLENYGLRIAKEMVQGVDLWLNTPRRGEEACGTSGMKAALNGVLNLSILDGWYDEAYEDSGGWAIGGRDDYREDQDDLHALDIYSTLENDILPLFYRRNDDGVPEAWVDRMKTCLKNMSPRFNAQRMIEDYTTRLYRPAHAAFEQMRSGTFQLARQRAQWDTKIQSVWDRVQIREAGPLTSQKELTAGESIAVRAVVDLAGLEPKDVRVEVAVGRIGPDGQLQSTRISALTPTETKDGLHVFTQQLVPELMGRLGYAFRISPNQTEDPLRRQCQGRMKWS